MKKYFIFFILLILSITLPYGFYLYEIQRQHIHQKMLDDLTIMQLSEKQLQYMECVQYPFDKNSILWDKWGKNCSLDSLLSEGSRLVLYIDNSHCTSCWKKELLFLEELCDTVKFANVPIIIANNFSARELSLMNSNIGLELYRMEAFGNILSPLTKFNVPFYFVLTEDFKITCPFFPSDKVIGLYPNLYFKHVQLLTQKSEQEQNFTDEGIVVNNDYIDLGNIQMRRTTSSVFYIENKSNRICRIFRCIPSCSCVQVDSFSTAILPNNTGYIAFSIVKNSKGSFSHSIMMQTDILSRPVHLSFKGMCK